MAFRVWLSTEPALDPRDPGPGEQEIDAYPRGQVPLLVDSDMRVRLIDGEMERVVPPPLDLAGRIAAFPSFWESSYAVPSVAISIQRGENEWFIYLAALNAPRSLVPELFLANIASAAVVIARVAFWLASRVTSLLARLAQAAERLGRNISSSPLQVSGPREVAVAAAAFNCMQRRLLRLVPGRTELLAGISHDLRAPLTQIRLRLELMPDSPEREMNLRARDDVGAIIGTFLTYACASHEAEERSRIGQGALVGSICDDLADSGAAIDYAGESGLVVSCKRLAITRAVTNLLENAIKYGHEARVSTSHADGKAWALASASRRPSSRILAARCASPTVQGEAWGPRSSCHSERPADSRPGRSAQSPGR